MKEIFNGILKRIMSIAIFGYIVMTVWNIIVSQSFGYDILQWQTATLIGVGLTFAADLKGFIDRHSIWEFLGWAVVYVSLTIILK